MMMNNVNNTKMDNSQSDKIMQQVSNMNMEITLFREKFHNFRQYFNVVDKNLLNNLESVYKDIEAFLDNEPSIWENTDSNITTAFNINMKSNYIHRIFVCSMCSAEIGSSSIDVFKHVACNTNHNTHMLRAIKTIEKLCDPTLTTGTTAVEKTKSVDKIKNVGQLKEKQNNKPNANFTTTNNKVKNHQQPVERNLRKKAKLFLSSDIGKFIDSALLTSKGIQNSPINRKIERRILSSIINAFPDAKTYLFGSRINGLCDINSDLDVFLDIGNMYSKLQYNQHEVIIKLKRVMMLLEQDSGWRHFAPITAARVPILRVYNSIEKVDCDISFSNGLGHKNTLLIKYYFELQPICHKMCIFLKRWLQVTQLKTNFSTYTFVLMVIFYLQIETYLPSVKVLQDDVQIPFEIGPWQGNFIQKSLEELCIDKIPDDNMNCVNLIRKFFKYYTNNINFKTAIICPYLGRVILKSSINQNTFTEIPRYSKYFMADPKNNTFKFDVPLCVQDPLELNHNVCKGISKGCLETLKQYFIESSSDFKEV